MMKFAAMMIATMGVLALADSAEAGRRRVYMAPAPVHFVPVHAAPAPVVMHSFHGPVVPVTHVAPAPVMMTPVVAPVRTTVRVGPFGRVRVRHHAW